jgi:hypothetical protein
LPPTALVGAAFAADDADDDADADEAAGAWVAIEVTPAPELEGATEAEAAAAVVDPGALVGVPLVFGADEDAAGVEDVAELETAEEADGLDPPALTGATLFFNVSRAWVTSRAESCCPMPEAESNPPVYHFEPQAFASPEHDLAAPTADARSQVEILSLVNGARIAVLARNRARYALKDC